MSFKQMSSRKLQPLRHIRHYAAVALSALVLCLPFNAQPLSAATDCTTAPNSLCGTVTGTINVPAAGTYRVWSRIMAPDTTNNSYWLQIDGGSAINVGDSSSIAANTWVWVNYKNGSTSTPIDVAFTTAGNHTILMTGREPGVSVDRVILTTDTSSASCNPPTGTGDTCAVAVTPTPPPTPPTPPPTPSGPPSTPTTVGAGTYDDVKAGYDGSWQIGSGSDEYQGGDIYTATTGATATISFTGTSIQVFGAKANNNGQASYSIDGGTATTVDYYAPSRQGMASMYTSPTLTSGTHTLVIKNLSTRNAASTGNYITVDEFIVSAAALKTGDVNGDGAVNIFDASIVSAHWMQTGATRATGDLNGDGVVNIFDASILSANWGK